MSLSTGTRIGPYEIVAPLGAGGMGEVFRARDPRLERDVAIKALPAAFAGDAERLARFEREAKLLASLSHANIAGIHGLEEAGGAHYLALELVEGETLAARLQRGPLPLDEALEVAKQIAAGVEAAHENDVVHRDLKPGNVMLTPAGDVKVLDFGLAKSGAADRAGSDPNLSASPTMTYAGTEAGVILGTAAYMSPEQARGRAVDKRSDIWSFGCVLFECLTGRQAFAGETVSDIVARILQTEPEWSALPEKTPERLRKLLARCLEKDVKRRLRDIGEARIQIEDLIAARSTKSGVVRTERPARAATPPWAAIAVTAVVVAAATGFAPRLFVRATPPPAVRFEVAAPKGHFIPTDAARLSISPDGTRLAIIAADSAGTFEIWVRRLDSLVPRRLPGTEGALSSFWSPDSRWLAFFANDEALMRIGADGTGLERICETKSGRGGSWGKDGQIVFAPVSNGGIYRVSSRGGTPVQLTWPDSASGVTGHRFPMLLPDGKHFLFAGVPAGPDRKGGLHVGSLDGGPTREIARIESGMTWVAPGWLLGSRNASLVAWRFDMRSLKIVGDPVSVGDPLVQTSFAGCSFLTASGDGTLAFLTRQDVPMRASWYDLAAQREVGAPPVPAGSYQNVALAPDDRRAVFSVQTEPARADLVLADLDRGVMTRLTESREDVFNAIWSWDGTQVAYVDQLSQTVRVRSVIDGSMHEFLADDRAYKQVLDFTPDSRSLLYARLDAATKWDLWLQPLDGGPPTPCRTGPANETDGQISPDGRWLQFRTDESGVEEVCVAPFLKPGLKYQVTVGGGVGRFSSDGKQFLFLEARAPGAGRVADIRPGDAFTLGPSRPWFRVPPGGGEFDFAHDDRRVLRLTPAEAPAPQAATILQNWEAAIRRP
jgi:Tol biopolymer transport system component